MKTTNIKILSAFLSVCVLTFTLPQNAMADLEVYAPYITKGKVKLQSRSEYTVDDDNKVDGSVEQFFEVGYGVTDRLFLEVGTTLVDKPNKDLETKDVILRAKTQFTQKGEYFADVGAKVAYKYSITGDADVLKTKLLLGKEVGKFAGIVNLELETELGEDSSDRQKVKSAFQARYKFSPYFEPSVEYFANFKDTTKDFDDQEHFAGPVVFGKISDSLKYEAGALFGVSEKAPDAVLKLNFVYKFKI